MGFRYQRRIRTGRNSWINLSKSGMSGSMKVGPFTMNSRGRTSIRLGRGLSYRTGCAMPMALVAVLVIGLSVVVAR